MLGMKIGLAGAALGLMAAGLFFWLWSGERSAHDMTKALLVAETIKSEITEARLDDLQKKQAKQVEQITELGRDLNQSQAANADARASAAEVQAKIEWMALRKPFEAGNLAAVSLCDSMQRLQAASGGGDSRSLTSCRVRTGDAAAPEAVSSGGDGGGGTPG